jgi:hypothetical protein
MDRVQRTLAHETTQAEDEARKLGIVFEPDDERGLPEELRAEAAALREGWRSACAWLEAMERFAAKLPAEQAKDWCDHVGFARQVATHLIDAELDKVSFWRCYYLNEPPKMAERRMRC